MKRDSVKIFLQQERDFNGVMVDCNVETGLAKKLKVIFLEVLDNTS